MSSSAAVTGLAVLTLAALLGGVALNQVMAWDAVWEAWLAAPRPEGGGFRGPYLDALGQLPVWMLVAFVLVVISLASPVSIRLRR